MLIDLVIFGWNLFLKAYFQTNVASDKAEKNESEKKLEGAYIRHFQKMMTLHINHAEIFTRDANSHLVHIGKVSFWFGKYFKSYQKFSSPKLHES